MSETLLEVKSQPTIDGVKPEVDAQSLTVESLPIFKQVTLRVNNGRCILERDGLTIGSKDFVGLYDNGAIDDPWGSKAWKWCAEGDFPFHTNVNAVIGYVAQYYSYDFLRGRYYRVAVTPHLTKEIIDAGGSVTARTTC